MNHAWIAYLPATLRQRLEGRHQLQKAIGNSGWLLLDRALRMVIGLTIGAWVARYLGPAQFGELAYVISFIAFFQVITRFEGDAFIVRDIAQQRGESSTVLGTAMRLRLLLGTASWGVAVIVMALIHPHDHQLILLSAIVGGTLVFQACETVDLWFQSQSQSRRTVAAKLVAYLVSNGVKVMLLLYHAPLSAFAAVMCLEGAAIAVGLAVAYRRFPTDSTWKGSMEHAKKLLHQCWPYIVSGILITTYLRIDQIMLKEMLGESELGIYAAAVPLSQVWTVIPATLITSLGPHVARAKSQSEESYRELLVKIFRLFAIVALLGAGATALASPWVINVLYGPRFQYAAVILSTHVLVNVFIFQSMAQSLWVVNNNVRAITLICTFLSAVINVVSNVALIRIFGTLGAAFSILLTEFASAAFPTLFQRDLREIYRKAFFPFVVKGQTEPASTR